MKTVLLSFFAFVFVMNTAFTGSKYNCATPVLTNGPKDSLKIGDLAPDLKMRDVNLNVISLSDIKTPYIILFFWDPECVHCKRAVPKLDSIYVSYLKKKGCAIFGVNLDENKQEWIDYIKDHKLSRDWINVWDPKNESDFRKKYDVYSSPVMYVLDRKRRVVAQKIKVEDVKYFIDNISQRDEKEQSINTADSIQEIISVYPNPSQGQFFVQISSKDISEKDVKIEIMNISGQVVQVVNSHISDGILKETVKAGSNISSGMYLLRTTIGGNVYNSKIIITR